MCIAIAVTEVATSLDRGQLQSTRRQAAGFRGLVQMASSAEATLTLVNTAPVACLMMQGGRKEALNTTGGVVAPIS